MHSVKNFYFDLDLAGNEESSDRFNHDITDFVKASLIPQLQRLFDAHFPEQQFIQIDQLHIDLGNLEVNSTELDQLKPLLEKIFIEKATESIAALQTSSLLADNSTTKLSEKDIPNNLNAQQQSLWQQWLYFLRTGTYHWANARHSGEQLEHKAQKLFLNSSNTSIYLPYLLPLLKESNNFRLRFAFHLLPETIENISHFIESPIREIIYLYLKQVVPKQLEADRGHIKINYLVVEALLTNGMSEQNRLQRIASLFQPHDLASLALEANNPQEKNCILTLINSASPHLNVQNSIEAQHKIDTTNSVHSNSSLAESYSRVIDKKDQAEVTDSKSELLVTDAIYIEVAGAVILHPFLVRFLTHVGLAENETITDYTRAVNLCFYLCTGQSATSEHSLTLFKVLCGLPVTSVIAPGIEPTEHEINASQELLDVVISYWSALHNTSADGLRGTFFCREGKLQINALNQWHLTVEQRTFDILLDSLPWGIGTIRLPWMRDLLLVSWS